MTTFTMTRQSAFGPAFQVHKHNCRDTAKTHPYDKYEVEASGMKEIVNFMYGPEAGGFYEEAGFDPGSPEYDAAWEHYTGDFRIMPCARKDIPLD